MDHYHSSEIVKALQEQNKLIERLIDVIEKKSFHNPNLGGGASSYVVCSCYRCGWNGGPGYYGGGGSPMNMPR